MRKWLLNQILFIRRRRESRALSTTRSFPELISGVYAAQDGEQDGDERVRVVSFLKPIMAQRASCDFAIPAK